MTTTAKVETFRFVDYDGDSVEFTGTEREMWGAWSKADKMAYVTDAEGYLMAGDDEFYHR